MAVLLRVVHVVHATPAKEVPRRQDIHIAILGAAGRDFHNFNVVYRDDPTAVVVAFTAAQIPGIAGRRYPPSLAGARYPGGIPIEDESALVRATPLERGSNVPAGSPRTTARRPCAPLTR